MTLEEAIEMLGRIADQDEESGRPECVEAEKLGIEAIKFKQAIRAHTVNDFDALLPSETEESQ